MAPSACRGLNSGRRHTHQLITVGRGACRAAAARPGLSAAATIAHMGAMIDPNTERGAGALVLFSGGQDSTVCLAWALDRYGRVETVGFDYGQRHAVELEARAAVRARVAEEFPEWAPRLGEDHVLEMRGFGAVAQSALT